MRVNLLYFASFRDAAGKAEETRELPDGTRVGQLWHSVSREIPRLAAFPTMPPRQSTANMWTATWSFDGDEVAFFAGPEAD
jgi:molybdopterin converting factor small subunit